MWTKTIFSSSKMSTKVSENEPVPFLDFWGKFQWCSQVIPDHLEFWILSDIWDILPWLDNLNMGQKWSRVFVFRSFSNNKFTSGREKVVEVSYRLQTARIKALRARIWPVHQRTKRYGFLMKFVATLNTHPYFQLSPVDHHLRPPVCRITTRRVRITWIQRYRRMGKTYFQT